MSKITKKSVKPRTRRDERTRQSIIYTAQNILSQQGIDGLSMRAIAEQIDYSPAGLYEYFDGKEEIIQAVRQEGVQRLQLQLQQTVALSSPLDGIKKLGDFTRNLRIETPSTSTSSSPMIYNLGMTAPSLTFLR